jgi:hypothetical protein
VAVVSPAGASLVMAPERFGNGMLTSQFKPRRQRVAETYLSPQEARGEAVGGGA